MVGENTPPDTATITDMTNAEDALTDSLNRNEEAGRRASETLNLFNSVSSYSKTVLDSLNIRLKESGIDLENLGNPATMATSKFGLLATAVVGATESFKGLQGVDTGNLSTFKDQLKDTVDILSQSGTTGSIAASALNKISNMLMSMGRPASEVNSKLKEGISAFKMYAMNVIESADNGLRLQNALIQLSAQTGNLGDVFKLAGTNLNDMNDLLAKQSNTLKMAGDDTKLSAGQLQQYYSVLGTIPGVLGEMSTQLTESDKKTNILSSTVLLAMGSGRKYADVIGDMRKAVVEYGLSTSQALDFTARISEVSQRFKAPMEDVRNAVLSTANAFKTFADAGDASARQSEGFARIMANYIGTLKDTGLSAHESMNLITQMTTSISRLSVEQKAFLSAQTGGPGGLMGAFQIDKALREGKLDEVFEKVRQQLQKQMGRIVTLDEAASSPAAALQLERQKQLLQRGPLGGFARTDQDAYRILELLQKRQMGMISPAELSRQATSDQVERGRRVRDLSTTPLSDFRSMLQGIQYSVNVANLSTMQRALTANAGIRLAPTEVESQRLMRERLRVESTPGANSTLATMTSESLNNIKQWFKSLPNTTKATFEGLKQAIESGKADNIVDARQRLEQELLFKKNTPQGRLSEQALSNMPRVEIQSREEAAAKDAFSDLNIESPNFGTVAVGAAGTTTAPSEMVRNAARQGAATTPAGVIPTAEATRATAPGTPAEMNFKVNVNAICTVCGHKVETHEQTDSVSTTARKLTPS